MSVDPLAVHVLGADLNLYAYVSGRALRNVDPRGLQDKPGPVVIDEVTIEGSAAPVELTDEQIIANSNMVDAFRAMEAGDKELAGRILFGPSEQVPERKEPDMAAAFANGALSIATFDWAHEEPRLPSKPLLGGSAGDVEYGTAIGLMWLGSVGDALALGQVERKVLTAPSLLRSAGSKASASVADDALRAEVAAALDEANSGRTTLWHGGDLRGGAVESGKFSTSTEMAHAQQYAEMRGGQLYRFDVPNSVLREGRLTGGIEDLTDSLAGTTRSAPEVRFLGDFSLKLNEYLVR